MTPGTDGQGGCRRGPQSATLLAARSESSSAPAQRRTLAPTGNTPHMERGASAPCRPKGEGGGRHGIRSNVQGGSACASGGRRRPSDGRRLRGLGAARLSVRGRRAPPDVRRPPRAADRMAPAWAPRRPHGHGRGSPRLPRRRGASLRPLDADCARHSDARPLHPSAGTAQTRRAPCAEYSPGERASVRQALRL